MTFIDVGSKGDTREQYLNRVFDRATESLAEHGVHAVVVDRPNGLLLVIDSLNEYARKYLVGFSDAITQHGIKAGMTGMHGKHLFLAQYTD